MVHTRRVDNARTSLNKITIMISLPFFPFGAQTIGRLFHGKRLLAHEPHPNERVSFTALHRRIEKAVLNYIALGEVDRSTTTTSEMGPQDIPVQVVTEKTKEGVIRHMKEATQPFDVLVTNYGKPAGPNGIPSCIDLMDEMRASVPSSSWAPVIVFSTPKDVAERRKEVQRQGAFEYCYTFEGMIKALERLFLGAENI